MKRVTVLSRLGEQSGVSNGKIAAFDRVSNGGRDPVRHYIMLDKSVKLMFEPWSHQENSVQNFWYIDLIQVEHVDDGTIQLTDLYIDVWVKGNGPTYEMMDMHELGEALANGDVTPEQMKKPLADLQRFLDDHLNFGAKDFPPTAIRPFMEGDLNDLL